MPMAEASLDLVSFDISDDAVARVASGASSTVGVADEQLAGALSSHLTVTIDPNEIGGAEAIFICVPSPPGVHREPDLSHIRSPDESLASVVRSGMFPSLESTTYPDTTSEVLVSAVTADGL